MDVIGEILGVKIDSRHTAIELLTFLTLTENMDYKFYSVYRRFLLFCNLHLKHGLQILLCL